MADCPGATFPSAACSWPTVHQTPFGGDWATDLTASSGSSVVVYAAPQNSALPITARVLSVGPTCASGNLAAGGSAVKVGFYYNGSEIGWALYGHINPSVQAGQTISRWGTTLGTLGSYAWNSCWRGVNLHFEMYSVRHYACYNRGWQPGQAVNPTNFLGYTGGNFAGSPRQACP